jgi:predicted DNA-binding transcriptional regulator AlpA
MVMTAVSSAKVAVMESGEVGRSAVYRMYSKGPRTLPWGTPVLTGVRSVRSVLTFMMKWQLDR